MSRLFERVNSDEVYVIAEMSANHCGKLDYALEIVRSAAKAGADCLKIQTYTADTMTIDCDNSYFCINGGLWDGYNLYELYEEASTPWNWQIKIKEECDKCGIDFLSTPFDGSSVDFLDSLGADSYKIASFELVDIPFIEYTASKGKPMIMSCGMASFEEIQDAVEACLRSGNDKIVLLKCCSEYPANWKEMHLANIKDMIDRFPYTIGLSDHSIGDFGAIIAVMLGARVIEKHIKLPDTKSVDSEFSMSVDEFASMVSRIRSIPDIIGEVSYGPNGKESDSMRFRRSLFAVKDINKGDIFTEENIRSIRPGYGLAPKFYKNLIGNMSNKDIKRGEPLTDDLL